DHKSAWTSSRLIILCGYISFHYLNTGGRYNPGTDSWVATSTTNAPPHSDLHTAVWTGIRMVVWGGENGFYNGIYLNTGGRYIPSTDSWTLTSTTNVPAARRFHTAVWTGSKMVVWGGSNGGFLNTGGKY